MLLASRSHGFPPFIRMSNPKPELISFVATALDADAASLHIAALSGDASFRRYFRVTL